MPRPQWRPVEELTPFARLVREGYMWAQTPNLSVSDLATRTGISKQTIWSWLNHGAIPRRASIVQLAETTGLDLDELLASVGLPTTEDVRAARVEEIDRLRASVAMVERALMADALLSPETKAALARSIDMLRAQPERFISSTDTYREWNALSPAEHEARRARETAQVERPERQTPRAERQTGQTGTRRTSGEPSRPASE